jgi:phospholipid N-methyltransferase
MFDFIEYKKRFLEATKDWNNEKWNNFDDNPFLLSAPMLQDCHVKNCRFVESRLKILEYLPKNSVVAEVGTQYGHFAEKILAIAKPKKLHLIDYNFDLFKAEISKKQKSLVQEGIENGTVELHEGDSSTILRAFLTSILTGYISMPTTPIKVYAKIFSKVILKLKPQE